MWKTDYLSWVKDLDERIASDGGFDFANSGVKRSDNFTRAFRRTVNSSLKGPAASGLCGGIPWGDSKLRSAIGNAYGIDAARVCTVSGASLAYYITCKALVRPGQLVLIESPGYQPLYAAPESLGALVRPYVRAEPHYDISDLVFDRVIAAHPRLVVISNLHNPSGTLVPDSQLARLAKELRSNGGYLVIDEVFRDLAPRNATHRAELLMADNVVIISSLSKSYGLSLLRCGWVIASLEIIRSIRNAWVLVENVGSALTEALAGAVTEDLEVYRNVAVSIVSKNRQLVQEALQPAIDSGFLIGMIPQYGPLYFPQLLNASDTDEFVQFASVRGIYIVPGKFFGDSRHFRIGFGSFGRDRSRGLAELRSVIEMWLKAIARERRSP